MWRVPSSGEVSTCNSSTPQNLLSLTTLHPSTPQAQQSLRLCPLITPHAPQKPGAHPPTPRPKNSPVLTIAISYRCFKLMVATVSCPGRSAPRARPDACLMYQLEGGPFRIQS